MHRSLKEILKYSIRALDREIGKVRDFYFDDLDWIIQYIVVDTGGWMTGKEVLISPESAGAPDTSTRELPVNLDSEQIKNSPGIDYDMPVSQQKKLELASMHFWTPGFSLAGHPFIKSVDAAREMSQIEENLDGDRHLRSFKELLDYSIKTKNDEIGRVVDFITETRLWKIRYMVVATHSFLNSRKVLISPDWIIDVDWGSRQVEVDLTVEQVKKSPEYDPSMAINREYEEILYDFYGRPVYWP